jgi:hypothetical protein
MVISEEIALEDFPFWGQAARNAALLTEEELHDMDMLMNSIYGDSVEKTHVNDLFAYYFDEICEALGLNVEEVYARSAD